jgi:putative peptidoglycan lipid II flippase
MKINNFSKITLNIFGSRVTGLIRDILFANYLGANLLADAFLFAFRLPNLFRRIFAEGAVNSVFIPLFVKQEKENSKLSNQFLWWIFIIFFFITSLITVFIHLFSDQVINLLAPGFVENLNQFSFAKKLLSITFPFLIFVTLCAILSSVLNAKGYFFLPSILSVILNLSMVSALILFKSNSHLALAWSMIIAGVIQLFLLLININIIKGFSKITINSFVLLNKKIVIFFKRFFYSVLGSGIIQLNIFISMLFASLVGEGAISQIYYADRIIDLPFALIAVAISITLLPYLSRNKDDLVKISEAFNQTIVLCLIFAIPTSVAILMISQDIISVLFGRGEFNFSNILLSSNILKVYAISLPGYMIARICNQIFYSYERVDLPVKASIPTFVCNLIFCFIFYENLGVVGLALSGVISVWLNVVIQIFYLKKYFYDFYKKIKIFDLFKLFKISLAILPLIIVIYLIDNNFEFNKYLNLFLQIFLSIVVYFTTLYLLKLKESQLIYKNKFFN